MALDDHTYGFNKDDAEDLLRGLGMRETEIPEVQPRGGGGGGGGGSGAVLYRFTLTGAMAIGIANADIKLLDGTAHESDQVRDPVNIFASLTTGDHGLCLLQSGLYYVIQAPCPDPPE